MDQTFCTRSGGARGGYVTYRLRREEPGIYPDVTVQTARLECSRTDQRVLWGTGANRQYHWDLSETPGGCLSTPNAQCPVDLTGRTYYSR